MDASKKYYFVFLSIERGMADGSNCKKCSRWLIILNEKFFRNPLPSQKKTVYGRVIEIGYSFSHLGIFFCIKRFQNVARRSK